MNNNQTTWVKISATAVARPRWIPDWRALLKSVFLKNVSTVMLGTAAAQIIGLTLMPVISRIFTPADFGAFGSFTAVLGVFGAGVTLQYSLALMLPKEEKEVVDLFVLSCLASMVVACLCLFAIILFPHLMLSLLKTQGMPWLLWILPFGVLVSGFNQSIQCWCIRRKAFRKTSLSQVVRSLSASVFQVIMGFGGLGGGGMVGGSVLGDAAATVILCGAIKREDYRYIWACRKWRELWRVALSYSDFPAYATPQNVLNAASQGIPILLLANYFGLAVAGSYALGVRILQAPMNLILTALRQVLFQRFSEAHNHGERLFPLFVKMTAGLGGLSAIPCLFGFIWAPHMFSSLLGHQWFEAGVYARWLLLWLGVLFCNLPSTLLGRILRKQRYLLLFDIFLLIARTASLVIGGCLLDPLKTIILFSLIGALFNAWLIFRIGRLVLCSDGSSMVANEIPLPVIQESAS
jgi:O-antigen/teichoic acid export membrane protein